MESGGQASGTAAFGCGDSIASLFLWCVFFNTHECKSGLYGEEVFTFRPGFASVDLRALLFSNTCCPKSLHYRKLIY